MTKTDRLFYGYREFHADCRKMAPVERTNWLNHHLNEMARIVIKYGGTRDKYIGDGVMVFFGDPTSRGPIQHAIQCVKMAQEMIFRTRSWDSIFASASALANAPSATSAASTVRIIPSQAKRSMSPSASKGSQREVVSLFLNRLISL